MNDWVERKVKDLCILGRGRVISADEIVNNPGIYPVFSSQSTDKGEMGRINTYDFEGEYVTWTTDGAYAGTVFYRNGKFNCTNVCGTLKAKDNKLSMDFLAYKLSTVAKKHVSYVGNPKLMNTIMAEIKISLPENIEEQTQIAAILSTVDKAIEQTEALVAKYRRIKTGLMQDLLTKGIDEYGNIRSEETHEFKDSTFGKIPYKWDVLPMTSLCELIEDCKNRTPPFVESGFPVLRTSNIKGGKLLWQDMKFTNEAGYKEWTRRAIPREDDLIITREAPLGEALLIPKGLQLCLGQRLMLFRADLNKLCPQYALYSILSTKVQKYLNSIGHGSTVKHLKVDELKNVKIPVPGIDEQILIADTLTEIDKTITKEEIYFSKLQKIKTGLMQDLLTGKVRVSEGKMPETTFEEEIKQ